MRYNFHEQLQLVKKNPRYVLPEDINKPVDDFLNKMGCTIGLDTLKKMREKIMYGALEIKKLGVNGTITIQVDCGMADGWKEYEGHNGGGWEITMYKTIRNANLDKKRLTKE